MKCCPFPTSIPKFCQDAARLYYLTIKHELHHRKQRKDNITSLSCKIDDHMDYLFEVRDCLDKSIADGSLIGTVFNKQRLNHGIKTLDKLLNRMWYISPKNKENVNSVSDSDIQAAKDRPFEDVLSWYGVQVRMNRCKCPVHGGKNPSSFSIKDNRAYCHCGFRGDTIEFVMKMDGVTFHEAVRKLV